LEEWPERAAKASGIAELKAFGVKLLQDSEAMVAAMILPYSQGQTEVRVNKFKVVKRSIYGRGNFDLLHQRVLYAAAERSDLLIREHPALLHQRLRRTVLTGHKPTPDALDSLSRPSGDMPL
jgi:Transposase